MSSSLVAYDDSDSETETEKTEAPRTSSRQTSHPSTSVNCVQYFASGSLCTKSVYEMQPPESTDSSGTSTACEVPPVRYAQNNMNLASSYCRSPYSGHNVLCMSYKNEQSSSSSTKSGNGISQKRMLRDSTTAIKGIRPYIPKRLRQENSSMPEQKEPEARNTSDYDDKPGISGEQTSRKISELIKPYLGSKYKLTELPKTVIFYMSKHSGPVNEIQWCPVREQSHMLLSASMDKTVKVLRVYKAAVQQTLDILFLAEGREFLTSTDAVSRDSADRTVIAWDFQSAAKISNQIFHERYTCPSLTLHPKESVFVAQTNGNYMALFSALRPYRINKKKRYEGHKVEGFAVGCEFSPDGTLLVTGSSDGKVFFYNYHTARIIRTLSAHKEACVSAVFHPVLPSLLATCDWAGEIKIWQ
ncbi:WD repeat-containing protein 25 isoform X2 [Melanerpes formicivorus]|uniref:WD repeat-containing protein 25 isoform X2 n=1 Tax=Melanerpes formicivorus TaxID=211600 RepID=UPI00358FC897